MKNLILMIVIFSLSLNSLYAQSDNGNCKITGTVLDRSNQSPIAGINVVVVGTKKGAITNKEGKFSISNLEDGVYSLRFSGVGYNAYVESNIAFMCGKPKTLEIELTQKIIELEGAEVRGSYFQERIRNYTSTQTYNSEEIRRAPGVQEDIIRATALLPGVAVTGAGRNDLFVRGGAPFENLFIVDNVELKNINHFGSQGTSGGPLSIINIDFVKNVDFSTGGFGAQYGNKVSSITDITLRKGNDQRFTGDLKLSATGFGAIAEGPIGEKGSFLFSARRSYLDLIFNAAGFNFVPQYWDFQTKADYKINNKNLLSFLTIGALDDVSLNYDDDESDYDNSRFAVPIQKQYVTGLTWKTIFKKGFANFTLGRSYTYFNTTQNDSLRNTIFKNESYEGETSFKADLDYQIGENFNLLAGNQIKYASKLDYDIFLPDSLRRDQNGVGRELDVDSNWTAIKNSTYLSLTSFIGAHKVTVGGRMDYYDFVDPKLYLSPRISAQYKLNSMFAFNLSAGRYYQPPSYIWLMGGTEQPLEAIQTDQIVVGFGHTPLADLKVQLEVYYKVYDNYPARIYRPHAVLAPSGFDDLFMDIPFGLEPIRSVGTGFSRGAEFFIQKRLGEIPLYGLLSLTVSQTKFESIAGVEHPGKFDSRFIINVSAGYRLPKEWEISAKFRAATGLPTTPFLDDGSGRRDYTRYNEGERFPFFHSLDVRVDKMWDLGGRFSLETFIDIQNLYSRENVSGVMWNYREQRKEYLKSFGILPSIGIVFTF